MRLDDCAADGQSHAHTLRLGRKEGIENSLQIRCVQAVSGIAHCDNQIIRFILAGANRQFSFAIPAGSEDG